MRPKQLDCLRGCSHLQADTHTWMRMLEFGDHLGQQIGAGKR